MLDRFFRVSKGRPCPICSEPGKPTTDWCLLAKDGTVAICARTPNDRPVGTKGAGFLYRLGEPVIRSSPRPRAAREPAPIDWQRLSDNCIAALPPNDRLHETLGVSRDSLGRLGLGWSATYKSWTFTMRDQDCQIVGLRTRQTDGAKRAVSGSRSGLFVPLGDREAASWWVVEGPSDVAAMLTIGFEGVVGRPSNTGGADYLVPFLRINQAREVIILIDRDVKPVAENLTWHGAEHLANSLRCPTKIVRIPHHKDIRAWVNAGADRQALLSLERNTLHQKSTRSFCA